jgi:hypothetical protein
MTSWLGVVSRDHVLRGVSLGIAQVNHGKKPPLARMRAGDGMVYYSPRTSYPDGPALQAFTAIGTIADEELWQATDGDFHPWRRRVDWSDSIETPIKPLLGELDLTREQNWGYALRRGLLVLSDADFERIRAVMVRR